MRRTAFRFYYDFNPFYTLIKWANTVNENDWWYQSNFDWCTKTSYDFHSIRIWLSSKRNDDDDDRKIFAEFTTEEEYFVQLLCANEYILAVRLKMRYIDSEWATMIAFVRSLALNLKSFRFVFAIHVTLYWNHQFEVNSEKQKRGDNSLSLTTLGGEFNDEKFPEMLISEV